MVAAARFRLTVFLRCHESGGSAAAAAGACRQRGPTRRLQPRARGAPGRAGRRQLADPAGRGASARGSAVLGLFFRQLFGSDTAVLDLRHGRFGERGGHHYWQPRPLYVTWDPGFLSALRQVYLGFYGDRPAQLHEGLDQLGIACAQTVFTKHFQYPDQHAVRFRLGDFRSGFHDAFLRCREARAHLHPNFVALGVYLACLYEHLEWLGGTHDVATAFRTQALR
jgi:hypothetical protein